MIIEFDNIPKIYLKVMVVSLESFLWEICLKIKQYLTKDL